MNYPVVFSRLAEKELLDQVLYLEENRSGYGHRFNQALRKVIKEIGDNPERYPTTQARPDLRCIRLPKPFQKSHSVYYKFDGKIVRILCLFPNSRSEKLWKDRK